MLRPLALAALIALPAPFASADTPNGQIYALVSRELPDYVNDVDVSQLSQHQLASIYMIMHSSDSAGERTAMIRSIIGGRFSLRSLFFK